MATLQEQLTRSKALNKANIVVTLFNFIRSIESYLKELNEEQIFKFSSDIYGKPLGFYSRATERITTEEWERGLRKESEIKEYGTPFTLRDSGVFLDNHLYAKVGRDLVYFGSTDPKTPEMLLNLLNKEIFGLTDDNLNKAIREKILPFYLKIVRQSIRL